MWYYTAQDQQHGPFDESALDQLVVSGTVTKDTYVWKDGMAKWLPLSQARPLVPVGSAPGDPASSTCTMCGKNVGADNLVELMGNRVCAECKPVLVQSLREGAALPAKENTAWREAKRIVAHTDGSLPARCFKCNLPVTGPPLKRKLYWHPAGYYLFILFNIIIYAVVAALVRKRTTLDIYLCDHHRQRRKNFIIVGWGGAALMLAVAIGGMVLNISWMIVTGFLGIFVAMIAGLIGASVARAARIKGGMVWISGSGKDFLASLPPLP